MNVSPNIAPAARLTKANSADLSLASLTEIVTKPISERRLTKITLAIAQRKFSEGTHTPRARLLPLSGVHVCMGNHQLESIRTLDRSDASKTHRNAADPRL